MLFAASSSVLTAAGSAVYNVSCDQILQPNVASNGVTTVSWKNYGIQTTTAILQGSVLYDTYNGRVWNCLLTDDFAYAPLCAQQLMEDWAYKQWVTASAQTTCSTAQRAPTNSVPPAIPTATSSKLCTLPLESNC